MDDEAPDPLADDEPAEKPDRRDWRGRIRPGQQVAGGFGVGHLLLWVSCCGVYFAAIRHLNEEAAGLVGLLIVLLLALGTGAGLAGMLLFFSRWLRGARWQVEPGEWLLPAFGARFAFELVAKIWLVEYLINRQEIATALTCCLLLLPLFGKTPRRWKAFYVVLILLYSIPLVSVGLDMIDQGRMLSTFCDSVATYTPLVAATAIGTLVTWDFLAGSRRGWLHGVGLGTFAWYLVAQELVA